MVNFEAYFSGTYFYDPLALSLSVFLFVCYVLRGAFVCLLFSVMVTILLLYSKKYLLRVASTTTVNSIASDDPRL